MTMLSLFFTRCGLLRLAVRLSFAASFIKKCHIYIQVVSHICYLYTVVTKLVDVLKCLFQYI